jgi:hypothetical protein
MEDWGMVELCRNPVMRDGAKSQFHTFAAHPHTASIPAVNYGYEIETMFLQIQLCNICLILCAFDALSHRCGVLHRDDGYNHKMYLQ